MKAFLSAIAVCLAVNVARASDEGRRTVIYDGIGVEISASNEGAKDLWMTMKDLKRATRFEVKPQGVCRDDLCFPLPKARNSEFILKKGAVSWFNLSEFARLIKQPFASDENRRVWYFGPRSEEINQRLTSLEAPDFTLPDMNGKPHSLSEFRGRKVLLLTWASW